MENSMEVPQNTKNKLSDDPAIPFLGVSKGNEIGIWKLFASHKFTAASFKIAKTREQQKGLSMDAQIKILHLQRRGRNCRIFCSVKWARHRKKNTAWSHLHVELNKSNSDAESRLGVIGDREAAGGGDGETLVRCTGAVVPMRASGSWCRARWLWLICGSENWGFTESGFRSLTTHANANCVRWYINEPDCSNHFTVICRSNNFYTLTIIQFIIKNKFKKTTNDCHLFWIHKLSR